jgi:hypothetical protein
MEPRDLTLADLDLQLGSPRGISSQYVDPAVAMLDTSLYRLKPGIRPETLRALLTAKGRRGRLAGRFRTVAMAARRAPARPGRPVGRLVVRIA